MTMINGRMPDEIKRGLSCKMAGQHCNFCSYQIDCISEDGDPGVINRDALALIKRLESERDAALAKVPKWISEHTLSLNTLRDEIYQDAVAHGLWKVDLSYPLDDCCELINDKLKELAEAADDYEYKSGTMDHFCEELADSVIVCMSIAGLHCIDIDAAIRRKMEINKNRPWKHGE